MKSLSRDMFSLEEPPPDSIIPSQEPVDPLVMEKYTHRLHTEVSARTWHSALPSLTPACTPSSAPSPPGSLCLSHKQ